MKKDRKLLSILITLCLVLSAAVFFVSAEDEEPEPAKAQGTEMLSSDTGEAQESIDTEKAGDIREAKEAEKTGPSEETEDAVKTEIAGENEDTVNTETTEDTKEKEKTESSKEPEEGEKEIKTKEKNESEKKESSEKTEETGKAAPDGEEMLIEGMEEPLKEIRMLKSASATRGASTGSRLDPLKIKSISWKHAGWSYLISWATLNPMDGTHKRKISGIKDADGNEMLDDPNVTAGYAYCCEPGTNTPEDIYFGHTFSADDGAYTAKNGGTVQGRNQIIRVFDEASAKAAGEEYAAMRKMLYYLPGGDGWKSTTKAWYTDFKNTHGLGKKGERGGITNEQSLAHLALSLKWQKLDANEQPVNGGVSAKQLVSWCDDDTQALINRYVKVVSSQQDPPEDFLVFYVYTQDAQDLWGVFGELDDSGSVKMKKESGNKGITG